MRELDELDRRHGLGAMPGVTRPRPRGSIGAPVLGVVMTAVLLVGALLVSPSADLQSARRLIGLGPDRAGTTVDFTPGEGTFAFLQTQPGSQDPVGYDPCHPIEYVVNPEGAPSFWRELVDTAVAHTEAASGLKFEFQGTTDQRPFDAEQRGPFAGSARPAVIGFADEGEISALAGDVAGIGGSMATGSTFGRRYYVTGSVALDTDVFTRPLGLGDRNELQAITDHEFGHLVGLGHVQDPHELMNGHNIGRTTYGPGDLEGLARLGQVPCR